MSELYGKLIAEQEVKIDLLRKALVTCKADWVKALLETKRLRAAVKRIRDLNATDDGWAHSDMIEQECVFALGGSDE